MTTVAPALPATSVAPTEISWHDLTSSEKAGVDVACDQLGVVFDEIALTRAPDGTVEVLSGHGCLTV